MIAAVREAVRPGGVVRELFKSRSDESHRVTALTIAKNTNQRRKIASVIAMSGAIRSSRRMSLRRHRWLGSDRTGGSISASQEPRVVVAINPSVGSRGELHALGQVASDRSS
jgi:hypothetical protein